uniref:Exocyst complex component Sec10 N-terminal domain-containing protein n=1 Tax=Opuntia streptacantha TaxID=393608 RepID=A0A7C9AM97_OPUST
MKEDGKVATGNGPPLILDIEDFKGDFSFDALFGNLVNELLPSYQNDDADAAEGNDVLANGTLRIPSDATKAAQGLAMPLFPEVDALLALFKDSCKELIDLRQQVDERLNSLKKEVSAQDAKHRKTLSEVSLQTLSSFLWKFNQIDGYV